MTPWFNDPKIDQAAHRVCRKGGGLACSCQQLQIASSQIVGAYVNGDADFVPRLFDDHMVLVQIEKYEEEGRVRNAA